MAEIAERGYAQPCGMMILTLACSAPHPNLQAVARSAPHPSKGRGSWQGGRGAEVTDPTPRYAHPSPTMGGGLITTSANHHENQISAISAISAGQK